MHAKDHATNDKSKTKTESMMFRLRNFIVGNMFEVDRGVFLTAVCVFCNVALIAPPPALLSLFPAKFAEVWSFSTSTSLNGLPIVAEFPQHPACTVGGVAFDAVIPIINRSVHDSLRYPAQADLIATPAR